MTDPTHMDPAYAQLLLRDDRQFRDQLCDWLSANGLDPAEIPQDATITIGHSGITTEVKTRNPDGTDVFTQTGDIVTDTVTVPLAVDPPPLVRAWLRPTCPTCGR